MLQIVRTTILGGVAFLIPVVVVAVVVDKALAWIRRLTDPVVEALPLLADHRLAALLVALLVLLAVCFFAGLFARTHWAKRLVDELEDRILVRIPFYTAFKTRAEAMLQAEELGILRPVLIRLDDAFQLAFEVERVEEEHVVVFVPGAPDPWAGAVMVVDADRVAELDLSVKIVENLCHRLGLGSSRALGAHFGGERATGT